MVTSCLLADMSVSMRTGVWWVQETFEPSKYQDQYRVALLEMIEAKRNGSQVVAPAEAPAARTTDLMAALKASLEAAKKSKQPANGKPPIGATPANAGLAGSGA